MSSSGDGTDPQQDLGSTPPDAAAQLMRQFQQTGDRAELERALLLCAPALRRAAVRLAGASDADDLLQECYLIAIRRSATFLPDLRLLPWLLGILNNVARSHHRRGGMLRRGSPSNSDDAVDEATLVGDEPEPATAIDRQEWQRRVVAVAEGLAEPYRTVVLEHLCAETPLVLLAERMGRTPSTVRSQFHRGLQELRRQLPPPMLGGLIAVLAVRDGRAMTATMPTDGKPPLRSRLPMLLGCGLMAALLSMPWWSSTPLAAPATLAPTTVGAVNAAASPGGDASRLAVADDERIAAPSATRALRLRFRSATGSAAADLTVWCDPDYVRGRTVPQVHTNWRSARTDADGIVVFELPKHTTSAVRLHELAVLQFLPPGAADVDWELTAPPGHMVHFECVDGDGRAVADATVFAGGSRGERSPMLPVARSDAHGRGTLRTVLDRTFLHAIAPGHRISPRLQVERSHDPNQRVTARFELPASERSVRGRVLAQDGQPLAGAVVAVWLANDDRRGPVYLVPDAAGSFATEHLPRGNWAAAAVTPEHAMAVQLCGEEETDCSLVLQRGFEVRGRVLLTAGLHPDDLRVATREVDGIPGNPFGATASAIATDGSFVLRNVHRGNFQIAVLDPSNSPIGNAKLEVVDAPPEPLTIDLLPSSVWQVRVVDPRGRAVPGCLLRSDGRAGLVGHLAPDHALTDGEGRGLLRRHTEPRRLSVFLKRGTNHDAFPIRILEHAEPGAGDQALQITVDPEQPRARLRGRLPESVRQLPDRGNLLLRRDAHELMIATDSEGAFDVGDLPPGEGWRLLWRRAEAPLCRIDLAHFDLTPGETKDLGMPELAGIGTLHLRLAAGATTSALHVTVLDDADLALSLATVRQGSEYSCMFPAGRYRLDSNGPDGRRRSQHVELAAGTTTSIAFPAEAGQPCRLFVPDSEAITNLQTLAMTIVSESATTDPPHPMPVAFDAALRGWSLDIDLLPGTYRVSVESGDGAHRGGTIVVSAKPGLQTFPLRLLR